MPVDHVALSRATSHALRHAPDAYGLMPDRHGWVDVADLVAGLRSAEPAWSLLTEHDLERMVERAGKRRHEIRDGRIRAVYGHSTAQRVIHTPATPPDRLYHGTTSEAFDQIMADGLRPMPRQYVHLSDDPAVATEVGRRRQRSPVIIEVLAAAAHAAGVAFYQPGEKIWLADHVPARFLRRLVP
jgi:putative RNA 2'-phosphotransferase